MVEERDSEYVMVYLSLGPSCIVTQKILQTATDVCIPNARQTLLEWSNLVMCDWKPRNSKAILCPSATVIDNTRVNPLIKNQLMSALEQRRLNKWLQKIEHLDISQLRFNPLTLPQNQRH